MSYNQGMDENKQYTEEEIKKMSYWQLWELRRKAGVWYFVPLLAGYVFMAYCFFKVLYLFMIRDVSVFKVDLWIIPIVILAGPAYFYFHEWYYKNVYLKKKS